MTKDEARRQLTCWTNPMMQHQALGIAIQTLKDMTSIEKILERYSDGLIGEDIALQCIMGVIDDDKNRTANKGT